MLPYNWEDSVGCWVVNTANAVRRALNAELVREGITLRQWEVLACLTHGQEMSQADIADRIGIEAPTLVGILDRMERDGWLERLNSVQDRRKKMVRCTTKAEQLWSRMVACAHRVRARAINHLTTADVEVFRSICSRIQQNLDKPDSGPMVTPDASLADTVCDVVPDTILQAAKGHRTTRKNVNN